MYTVNNNKSDAHAVKGHTYVQIDARTPHNRFGMNSFTFMLDLMSYRNQD